MADLRYTPMARMSLRLIVAWSVGVPALLTVAALVVGMWPFALISGALLIVAALVVQVVRRVAIDVELRDGRLVWSSLASSGELGLERITGLAKWRRLSDVIALELEDDERLLIAPGKGLLVLVAQLRLERPDLPEPNVGRMNELRERLPGRSHVTVG